MIFYIPLFSDVYIGDLTASGELGFQSLSGTVGVDSVDEKFGHFVFVFLLEMRFNLRNVLKINSTNKILDDHTRTAARQQVTLVLLISSGASG